MLTSYLGPDFCIQHEISSLLLQRALLSTNADVNLSPPSPSSITFLMLVARVKQADKYFSSVSSPN
jgi:hypothetical protein